jgi:putative drug exporter of the RND superfamily
MVALPGLGSEVNSDPSLFLSSSARSVQAASLGAPLLGKSTTSKITIVAARADGPLTSADIAAITREANLARHVTAVTSVRPTAVSPGDRAVQLEVTVSKEQTDVAGLRLVVSGLEATFPSAGAPPGLQLHLAGQVATNAANNKSANKAMGKITLYSIVFILVLLLIVLRSPVALLVTFAPSVVALLVSEKFVAGLGAHGLQISSITQTLLIVLMLGAGTDYGLFLVYRFREELRAGSQPRIAVVRALTRVGNPRRLPLNEPTSVRVPGSLYQAYLATGQYVSTDGTTVRFAAGLRAGSQQSTAAMNATPVVRAAVTASSSCRS